MQATIQNRTIFCSDNLHILKGIDTETIDLIYLDPPFNKKKEFTAPVKSSAEGASFSDIFRQKDIKEEWIQTIAEDNTALYELLNFARKAEGRTSYNFCYLAYMAIRLLHIHRVLKPAGSVYLHCDSTMSHYLKLTMDCIFGESNFRNEIIWQRNDRRAKGSQHRSKRFGNNTDSVLFYAKSALHELTVHKKLTEIESVEKFNKIDETGRKYYTGIPIFRSKSMGPRPHLCYEWRGFRNPYPSGWRLSKERLEEEYEKGNVIILADGNIERRKYADEYEGYPLDSNWTDIPRITAGSAESVGYPTQKPVALLERIIQASCPENGVVLDPFCGCATTCVAAEKLGKQWVGVDVSVKAYDLVRKRLQNEVEHKEAMPLYEQVYDQLVNFETDPPERTDSARNSAEEKKFVYVISHQKSPGEYKVGIAKNWNARLNSYQTADPDRAYKMEYTKLTSHFREIEKYIHEKFDNKHEWVRGELADIIHAINTYESG